MVFGDHVNAHPRWATFKKIDLAYGDAIKAAGGKVDVVMLPEVGITGNSHMLMMDKNNGAIADMIDKWLAGKGLSDRPGGGGRFHPLFPAAWARRFGAGAPCRSASFPRPARAGVPERSSRAASPRLKTSRRYGPLMHGTSPPPDRRNIGIH